MFYLKNIKALLGNLPLILCTITKHFSVLRKKNSLNSTNNALIPIIFRNQKFRCLGGLIGIFIWCSRRRILLMVDRA